MEKQVTWVKNKSEVIEKLQEQGKDISKVKFRKAKTSHDKAKKLAEERIFDDRDY